MLEKALRGNKTYFGWIAFLAVLFGIGFQFYLRQLGYGLGITGMSRDVSWGVYIGQFTFLVGVAASAVMLVLPYYLHNYKVFGKITILGEFLAVAAVTMCLSFIVADLGQPSRAFNVLLHPTPNSVLFWDMVVLNGYLFLNIVVGWSVLEAERKKRSTSELGETPNLFVYTVGGQHSYGHSVSLCRPAGKRFLVDRNHGPSILGIGFCIRPLIADTILPFPKKVHQI